MAEAISSTTVEIGISSFSVVKKAGQESDRSESRARWYVTSTERMIGSGESYSRSTQLFARAGRRKEAHGLEEREGIEGGTSVRT